MAEKYVAFKSDLALITILVVILLVAALIVGEMLSTNKEYSITIIKPGLLLCDSDVQSGVSLFPIKG